MKSNTRNIEKIRRDPFDTYQQYGYLTHRNLVAYGEIGIYPMLYTWSLCCDINLDPLERDYRYRYCYPDLNECLQDYANWDGKDHPKGNWIKRKGAGLEDISNPDYVDHSKGDVCYNQK